MALKLAYARRKNNYEKRLCFTFFDWIFDSNKWCLRNLSFDNKRGTMIEEFFVKLLGRHLADAVGAMILMLFIISIVYYFFKMIFFVITYSGI